MTQIHPDQVADHSKTWLAAFTVAAALIFVGFGFGICRASASGSTTSTAAYVTVSNAFGASQPHGEVQAHRHHPIPNPA